MPDAVLSWKLNFPLISSGHGHSHQQRKCWYEEIGGVYVMCHSVFIQLFVCPVVQFMLQCVPNINTKWTYWTDTQRYRYTDWETECVRECKEREWEGGVKFMSWGSNSFLFVLSRLSHLPKDPSGRSEKGKVWVSKCVCVCERERTKAMSHHTHMLALLCVGAQCQSLYRTIYSNQAVTFSSTPAGTSATLCAMRMITHTCPHIVSPSAPKTSLWGKHTYQTIKLSYPEEQTSTPLVWA